MSASPNYSSAIDELNSQLTPTQFTYLITALSAAAAGDDDIDQMSCSQEELANHTSLSSLSPSSLSGSTVNSIPSTRKIEVVHSSFHRYMADFQPTFPPTTRRVSRSRPPLLPLLSLETVTGRSSVSRHKTEKSERSSVLALRGGGSTDESMNELIYQAGMKYDKLQVQVSLHGEVIKPRESPSKRCNELPVCKKLLSKHTRGVGRISRSSSTETVKAESLPDIDNPLLSIAGRIANEPINPFPTVRKFDQMKDKNRARTPPHFTDRNRIEEGIDLSLRKFQDYKDVSEFFSKTVKRTGGGHGRNVKNHGKVYNLTRRVTNPLYKQYDPTGYHKSEDELGVECIQMICNDFNSWIKSLATKRKVEAVNSNSQQDDDHDGDQELEIGPDFLIQILRTELELPENEINLPKDATE